MSYERTHLVLYITESKFLYKRPEDALYRRAQDFEIWRLQGAPL